MSISSRLDRTEAREVLLGWGGDIYEPQVVRALDELETCVLPDPRIARIEALIQGLARLDVFLMPELRAILVGEA